MYKYTFIYKKIKNVEPTVFYVARRTHSYVNALVRICAKVYINHRNQFVAKFEKKQKSYAIFSLNQLRIRVILR